MTVTVEWQEDTKRWPQLGSRPGGSGDSCSEAVLSPVNSVRTFWTAPPPPPIPREHRRPAYWTCEDPEIQTTTWVVAPTEVRQKTTSNPGIRCCAGFIWCSSGSGTLRFFSKFRFTGREVVRGQWFTINRKCIQLVIRAAVTGYDSVLCYFLHQE
jgi:hypothetical protein